MRRGGRWLLLAALALAGPAAADLSPQEFSLKLREAHGHVRHGRVQAAIGIYRELHLIDPTNDRVVRGYAGALRQLGRFDEALQVYAGGDRDQTRPRFIMERIALLEQLERLDEALDLCLENLNTSRSIQQFVLGELVDLTRDQRLWRRAYDDLKRRFDDGRSPDALGTALAEVCLTGDRHEEAVEITRRVDRAVRGGGLRLFQIGKRLDALGQKELALEVADEVVDILEDPDQRRDAALFRAELQMRLGDAEGAYQGLTKVAARNESDRHLYEIQIRRAELLSGPLDRAEQAIAIYDELLATSRLVAVHERIRLARAETQLRLAHYDGALVDCRELASTSRKEEVRERASFMVGEIFFYQGEIDSAAAAYAWQIETFPNGILTNDGLDRIFLFNENYGADGSALVDLGRMFRLESEGELDRAIAFGDSLLARHRGAPAEDDLLFRLASIAKEAGMPGRAVAHADSIGTRFPESKLTPRVLKLKGEVQENDLLDAAAALATYEDLLVRFPLSIEASEVRPRVSRLRQEVRS